MASPFKTRMECGRGAFRGGGRGRGGGGGGRGRDKGGKENGGAGGGDGESSHQQEHAATSVQGQGQPSGNGGRGRGRGAGGAGQEGSKAQDGGVLGGGVAEPRPVQDVPPPSSGGPAQEGGRGGGQGGKGGERKKKGGRGGGGGGGGGVRGAEGAEGAGFTPGAADAQQEAGARRIEWAPDVKSGAAGGPPARPGSARPGGRPTSAHGSVSAAVAAAVVQGGQSPLASPAKPKKDARKKRWQVVDSFMGCGRSHPAFPKNRLMPRTRPFPPPTPPQRIA